jgi:HD-like signal output (HDOD) protein
MKSEELKTLIIGKIRNNTIKLPSLPHVIYKIEKRIEDDMASMGSIAELIQKDITLCSRILQVSNSPALRANVKINSIKEAINRIGLNTVKNIIMMIMLRDLFKSSDPQLSNLMTAIFKKSICLSNSATKFAQRNRKIGLNPDIVNFAGIIYYLGKLPVIDYYSSQQITDFQEVIDQSDELRDFFNQIIVTQWDVDYEIAMAITRNFNKPMTVDIGNLLYTTELFLDNREDQYIKSDNFMCVIWEDLKRNEEDDKASSDAIIASLLS